MALGLRAIGSRTKLKEVLGTDGTQYATTTCTREQ
jgi:hypothetical protein